MTDGHNCFECGDSAKYDHHVVPKVDGGTKTVPLCAKCHGIVHDRAFLNVSALTQRGLEQARQRGVRLGRPVRMPSEVCAEVVHLRTQKRWTLRQIAEEMTTRGVPTATGKATWTKANVQTTLKTAAAEEAYRQRLAAGRLDA
jgi:DNA invertase Pin-like site-specific DNA recombinase